MTRIAIEEIVMAENVALFGWPVIANTFLLAYEVVLPFTTTFVVDKFSVAPPSLIR